MRVHRGDAGDILRRLEGPYDLIFDDTAHSGPELFAVLQPLTWHLFAVKLPAVGETSAGQRAGPRPRGRRNPARRKRRTA